METHSSAIVATSTTAATSVAEIEKFLSRRQSRQQRQQRQQRRCIFLMETTGNFSSNGCDKNASQSTFYTVKTSNSATRHFLAHSSKWRPVEKSMWFSSWKKCRNTTVFTISTVKVIKTSIFR